MPLLLALGAYVVVIVAVLLAVAWATGGAGERAGGAGERLVPTRRRTGRGIRWAKPESTLPARDFHRANRAPHDRHLRIGGRASH